MEGLNSLYSFQNVELLYFHEEMEHISTDDFTEEILVCETFGSILCNRERLLRPVGWFSSLLVTLSIYFFPNSMPLLRFLESLPKGFHSLSCLSSEGFVSYWKFRMVRLPLGLCGHQLMRMKWHGRQATPVHPTRAVQLFY